MLCPWVRKRDQMIDGRFFRHAGPFALSALAIHIGADLPANAPEEFQISGVAPLDGAGEGEVSVFSDSSHRTAFENCNASVVVTSLELSKHGSSARWLLLTDNPRLAFAQIGHLFHPQGLLQPAI